MRSKKTQRTKDERSQSLVRHLIQYCAIKALVDNCHYPASRLCGYAHVAKAAYDRWLKNPHSERELRNNEVADHLRKYHEKHPDKGYRRLRDDLEREDGIHITDKRAHRICRKEHIQSTIRWRPKGCT